MLLLFDCSYFCFDYLNTLNSLNTSYDNDDNSWSLARVSLCEQALSNLAIPRKARSEAIAELDAG